MLTCPQELTFDELKSNASTLIIAGSETTATALSGITYFVLSDANVHRKLNDEIRGAFASEGEIDMVSVQKLGYLQAVINEGLRMYPPIPTGIVRRVTDDGGVFLGQYVPSGVSRTTRSPRFVKGATKENEMLTEEGGKNRLLCRFGTGLRTMTQRTLLFRTRSSPSAGSTTPVLQATGETGSSPSPSGR